MVTLRRGSNPMASSAGVTQRKSTNVYTPILPEEWKLTLSSAGPSPAPNEVGGPIGKVIKSAGAAFQKVDKGMRQTADRNLMNSLRFLLKKIGAIVLTAAHDSAMPRVVHKAIDDIFVITWPEAEKGILDGLVLDLGFQFHKGNSLTHEAQYPEGFFERCRATLLYAMKPYDLSFFGMMGYPTLFAINLIFLFPLLGVDSLCVITLWLCTYKYDEFQLAAFIITSKGLGLLTAGLISGAVGFVKLYMCSMIEDANDAGSCHNKAPPLSSTPDPPPSLCPPARFAGLQCALAPKHPPPLPPQTVRAGPWKVSDRRMGVLAVHVPRGATLGHLPPAQLSAGAADAAAQKPRAQSSDRGDAAAPPRPAAPHDDSGAAAGPSYPSLRSSAPLSSRGRI